MMFYKLHTPNEVYSLLESIEDINTNPIALRTAILSAIGLRVIKYPMSYCLLLSGYVPHYGNSYGYEQPVHFSSRIIKPQCKC